MPDQTFEQCAAEYMAKCDQEGIPRTSEGRTEALWEAMPWYLTTQIARQRIKRYVTDKLADDHVAQLLGYR